MGSEEISGYKVGFRFESIGLAFDLRSGVFHPGA